jgi:hypothetical protein
MPTSGIRRNCRMPAIWRKIKSEGEGRGGVKVCMYSKLKEGQFNAHLRTYRGVCCFLSDCPMRSACEPIKPLTRPIFGMDGPPLPDDPYRAKRKLHPSSCFPVWAFVNPRPTRFFFYPFETLSLNCDKFLLGALRRGRGFSPALYAVPCIGRLSSSSAALGRCARVLPSSPSIYGVCTTERRIAL